MAFWYWARLKKMRRYTITFILLLMFTLVWGGDAAVAAAGTSGRQTRSIPSHSYHSLISSDYSNWLYALLNNSLPQGLAACTPSPPVTRIMPLGDSITKGVYGSDYPETRPDSEIGGYRLPLYVELRNGGYSVDFVGGESAGSAYSSFDVNHEGHPGYRDSRVATNIYDWLVDTPADIILLHIGTNSLNSDPADVEDILDEIKRYRQDHPGTQITTVVARIIDRIPPDPTTTAFNDNVAAMIDGRDDKNTIIGVDMENGAGIVYDFSHNGGDMADDLHPYATGYAKMANQWLATIDGLGLTSCLLPPLIHATSTTANVGQPFTYPVLASGNPAPTFELIAYPEHMTINLTTGVIDWTPGAAGAFDVTVRATNSEGYDQETFTVTVANVPTPPVIASILHQNAFVGTPFIYDVNASGNPAPTFSLAQKPDDSMTINAATGLISWTPAATGTFNVTIQAANSQGADQKSFTITVAAPQRLFLPLITGN